MISWRKIKSYPYSLDKNPVEMLLKDELLFPPKMRGKSWIQESPMIHDSITYGEGEFGRFLDTEKVANYANDTIHFRDISWRDFFILQLMKAGGDAAIAIFQCQSRIKKNELRWAARQLKRFVSEPWSSPHLGRKIDYWKCRACNGQFDAQQKVRRHIGLCKLWSTLDELASKMLFVDSTGLDVALDLAEDNNWWVRGEDIANEREG